MSLRGQTIFITGAARGIGEHVARVAAAQARTRHVDLPGCGHVPMIDDPALVSRLILETTGALTTVD
jgi:NAD(P)-dependent dehydrogenase (short-subunit alcohol dehydrogenase family)